MNQAQLKAAIKAISPFLTFKVHQGECRLSVQPAFFQSFCDGFSGYRAACAKAEAVAAYDTYDNSDNAYLLSEARAMFDNVIKPYLIP